MSSQVAATELLARDSLIPTSLLEGALPSGLPRCRKHSLHMWTVARVHMVMCEPLPPFQPASNRLFFTFYWRGDVNVSWYYEGDDLAGVFWEVPHSQCDQISLHSTERNGSLWKLLPGITSNQRLLPIISTGSAAESRPLGLLDLLGLLGLPTDLLK